MQSNGVQPIVVRTRIRTVLHAQYGPRGWCNADSPALNYTCGCAVEGRAGQTCDQATEVFCPNQVRAAYRMLNPSGHGWCTAGAWLVLS